MRFIDSESGDESEPEARPWPEGTAHVVVLARDGKLACPGHVYQAKVDSDHDENVLVEFENGDELPEALWGSSWQGGSDRLAALDGNGERLDRPSVFEESELAEAALETWRRENGMIRRTVQVYQCDECGKEFNTQAALSGHMGAHAKTPESDEAAEAAGDAESESGESEGDSPALTAEAVEAADEAEVRALAGEHGLDADMGIERLRAELRSIAEDGGDRTLTTAADLVGGESA